MTGRQLRSKMSNMSYNIRNYRTEDFDKLVHLGAEAGEIEQTCRASVQDLLDNLGLPNHLPEKDLFVAENSGEIVGYVDVIPELDIGRVVLNYLIHPYHRGKDFVKKLVEFAIHRARELRIEIVHVNFPQDSTMAKRLFSKMGFRFVRRFLELRLNLSEAPLSKINQTAFLCRQLRGGEEDKLTQIQNRSFINTWGFNPNTIEEIRYRTGLPKYAAKNIILCWDADRPIGYCWTNTNLTEDKVLNGKRGRVYMLGVDPDYRGKGLAKDTLLAGLSYLKSKCIRIVELTADSDNKVALALYKSVGFKIWTSSLWYEKVLD